MNTLKIDDLETNKDLDVASMKTTTGGKFDENVLDLGGLTTGAFAFGGGNRLFSPEVATIVPINMPLGIQVNASPTIDLDIASMIDSAARIAR
jgi:hypothetical protein